MPAPRRWSTSSWPSSCWRWPRSWPWRTRSANRARAAQAGRSTASSALAGAGQRRLRADRVAGAALARARSRRWPQPAFVGLLQPHHLGSGGTGPGGGGGDGNDRPATSIDAPGDARAGRDWRDSESGHCSRRAGATLVEQAIQSANLWLTYAALFLLLVALAHPASAQLCAADRGAGWGSSSSRSRSSCGCSGPRLQTCSSPAGSTRRSATSTARGVCSRWGRGSALALAERRQPVLAGLGAAATVVMALLALLSQSRGAAIATGVAVVIALAVIPGFRRRVLVLVVVVAAMAAASGPVLHLYTLGQIGAISSGAAHRAAVAILLAAAIAGVVWGALAGARPARGSSRRAVPECADPDRHRCVGTRGGRALDRRRRCGPHRSSGPSGRNGISSSISPPAAPAVRR